MYAVELSVDLPSLTLLNTALASACIMNWYLSGRVVGSTESSISLMKPLYPVDITVLSLTKTHPHLVCVSWLLVDHNAASCMKILFQPVGFFRTSTLENIIINHSKILLYNHNFASL